MSKRANDAALNASLDPENWDELRRQGHRMLDDMFDFLEGMRERPVWRPIPEEKRAAFREALPVQPTDLDASYARFTQDIAPYVVGNYHPGFVGWVQGGGTPVGMLAEMLAGGLNVNLGGRDQIPLEVERQILQWVRELFGFPEGAGGLFVTGTSMANIIGVLVARRATVGPQVRTQGLAAGPRKLVAYTSAGAHSCIAQAMDIAGLGTDALRLIEVDERHSIDLAALARTVAADRAAGYQPFLITATAGTVDTGAIDDLDAIAQFAKRESLWFHVDGAFGALGILAPDIAPRLKGIEQADSLGFDFHKWGQVPYDAGFVLVRDGNLQLETFSIPTAYLSRAARGLSGGSPWPCDLGPDLSRGFRALKTWFTLKTYGTARLGAMISNSCAVARYLKERVEAEPRLELLAPVALNIVCFRMRHPEGDAAADRLNAELLILLQESGISVPSSTTIRGRLALRAAIVNHRTAACDMDALVDAVLDIGSKLLSAKP